MPSSVLGSGVTVRNTRNKVQAFSTGGFPEGDNKPSNTGVNKYWGVIRQVQQGNAVKGNRVIWDSLSEKVASKWQLTRENQPCQAG